MLLFLFTFFITNLLFSFSICSVFVRLNRNDSYNNSELLLYSLGLGPGLTTLILYYAFLFFPHRTNTFYFGLVVLLFFCIALIGKKHIREFIYDIKTTVKILFWFKKSIFEQKENIIYAVIIIIPLFAYLVIYLIKILPQPLIGHDILNYGITGKMLFDEKSLTPIWVKYFSKSGYEYRIHHPPSFALLLSWEEIVNSFFSVKGDLYFKSISAYYGFLIIGVQYYWVAKNNKWIALLAAFALLSGIGFFLQFFQRSIDAYRIFFIFISWIYLAYAIKENDFLSLLMLGIFTGFTAFAHRIGVVIAVLNCITFLIISDNNLYSRIRKTTILIIVTLTFGGSHYIFDLIFGQGTWLQYK